MDSSLKYAPSKNLGRHWPVAEPYILDALEHSPDGSNVFDVMSALDRGVGFLWTGKRAACVTLMQGTTYTLWLAGGDLDEIAAMWPSAEEHARGLGAKKVVVFGRKGWARTFLQPAGFTHKWSVMEKKLWAA